MFLGIVAASPAPEPAASPSAAATDHVLAFAGTFACRSDQGVIVHQTGERVGADVITHDDVVRGGKHEPFEDRYVFDAPLNRWHVDTGLGGFTGGASPWTGDTWIVQGRNADGVAVRMTTELLAGGGIRRTFAYQNGPGWMPYTTERCAPGTEPPPADDCIVRNAPAMTIQAARVNTNPLAPPRPAGTVRVLVSLDEESHVTAARVVLSDNPELNAPALAAARASRFRTLIRDCKPVKGDFIFTVDYY